jgi:hypothetical protein
MNEEEAVKVLQAIEWDVGDNVTIRGMLVQILSAEAAVRIYRALAVQRTYEKPS